MPETMEVDHNAIWSEVRRLKTETGEIKAEIQGLNGKLDTQFERLAGRLETLGAVLTERQEQQKQIVKDLNTLFERQRQTETRLSSMNCETLEVRLQDVENKQVKHGEKLAQTALVAGVGGILLAAIAPLAFTKLTGEPSKTGIAPATHSQIAPLM